MAINIGLLEKILAYYTLKYNLPYFEILLNNNYYNCSCNHSNNYIQLSPTYISDGFLTNRWKNRHPFAKTFETLTITIFLHEIKHAIDYLHYKNEYVDINATERERQADIFAEQEINKWL